MATRNPRGYGPQRYVNDNATSTVQEDGVEISDVISTFNFAGDGVSSSVVDDVVTVTIPGSFTVQEEGVNTSTTVRTLNFVGAATASGGAATATITVPAATISTQEEGVALSSTVNTINFVGPGVTASGAGATTTVTIPGTGFTGYTDTTAAGALVLTSASGTIQRLSGANAITVNLPSTATLSLGTVFRIFSDNTNAAGVIVRTSAATATVTTLAQASAGVNRGGWGDFVSVSTAGLHAASEWSYLAGATIL